MCLECSNCPLRLVAAVHVRRDFLVGALPYICDVFSVCRTCFVVHDLCVNRDAASLDALHDGVEGWYAMVVLLGCKRLYQYNISRIVVGKHNVLVTAHCTDWVASEVVGEKCCERYLPEDDLVGGCRHSVQ